MQISLFLKKFETLIHDGNVSKKMIREVLFHHLKKEFSNEDIKVFKGVLYINTDVFVKNSIFLKKNKIVSDLKKINKLEIKDIK